MVKPITIVGGGLAGLTLGIGLRQCGVAVTVHEAGHYPRHRVCGEFISGRYAFVMKTADSLRVDEVAFLDQTHSIYALRPKVPLDITFGFYSPSITFCYPGGEGPLNVPPHGI